MKETEFITVDNEHWYPSPSREGVYYPSVTTILQNFPKGVGFDKYLASQESYEDSRDILKRAGQRGTNVHDGTELLEKGIKLSKESYTLEEWQMLIGFCNWYGKTCPEIVAIEEPICSDTLRTGGKIDRVYMIDGVRTLLDIKTSGKIYENYWLQVGEYMRLWNEKHPDQLIEQTAILRLADGKADGYEIKYHDFGQAIEDAMVFDAMQVLWFYLNRNKTGPKIIEVPTELKLEIGAVKPKKVRKPRKKK
jgi:hypothetical protein